ncbi:MAG: sigma-54-dependent transcriptional regulator [Solirubrobacterales bacterium]
MGRILVIDDEKYIGWIIKKSFEPTDNDVFTCETAMDGILEVQKNNYDIVFLDLRLPDMDGMDVLLELKKLQKDLVVIIITAHGSIDSAIESMKKGAFDYITKPFDVDELLLQAEKAMNMLKLTKEINYLRDENLRELDEISLTSKNEELSSIYQSIPQIAKSQAPVFITGETGTGKEVVARKIHMLSSCSNEPFVIVNCNMDSETEVENEIFGYEKKKGKIEIAEKGTLFIEEINKLSLNLQKKLLETIEKKSYFRAGISDAIKLEARLIASSNKDLIREVEKGEFREDLYYKLNVLPVKLPPLRERIEDIHDLLDFFIKKYDSSKKIKGMSPDTVRFLKSYHWPGNIIELENVIERIVILCKEPYVKPSFLTEEIIKGSKSTKDPIIYFPEDGINLDNVEKELIVKALKISGQNQSKAAQLLNITRSALIYRMQKYEIK